MTKDLTKLNETIYSETIEDLRAKIESKFGGVRAFAIASKIDTANLYKVFNRTNGQEMSIGLFARIMTGLGVEGLETVQPSTLSLKQYLAIDNNLIFKSILSIKFS
jgi:hypothetical protein